MIASMTGFARETEEIEGSELTWEIRSVNHRYLDVSLRLGHVFREKESLFRKILTESIDRGRIDAQLHYHASALPTESGRLQPERVRVLREWAAAVQEMSPESAPLSVAEVLNWSGVIIADSADPQILVDQAQVLLQRTVSSLQSQRQREGKSLGIGIAKRVDECRRIAQGVQSMLGEISPRAALLYKPTETQTLRLTYNRAFSTPTTNNLYLDLVSAADPFGLGAFQSSLGFSPAVAVRAQGTYRDGFDEGFTFRRSTDGSPMYRSSFAPALQGQLAALGLTPGAPGYSLDADSYIALHDPIATNVQWNIGAAATLQQFGPALELLAPGLIAQQLIALGFDAATAQAQGEAGAAAVVASLPSLIPAQLPNLRNTLAELNLATFGFDPIADAIDVPRASSTITQTIEVGYKGIVGDNVVVSADLYRSEIENFGGPLQIETPNVFLDPVALSAALGPAFQDVLDDPANAQVASVLGALDQTSIAGVVTGNNNGTAADELTSIFVGGAARIPYGTVSPEQAYDPTAVLLTYRNFGDVTLYGVDLALGYYPTDQLTVTGSYSFVSDDFWPNLANVDDVALNAPKHKFKVGSAYDMPSLGLRVGANARHNGSFPMNSGVYVGDVDAYTLLDLQAKYALPYEGLSLLVNVDNALDNAYRAFVGAPEVGRLVYAQLGLDF